MRCARAIRLIVAIGDEVGGPGRVFTTYGELALKVHKGDHLLLDDGKVDLEVEEASPRRFARAWWMAASLASTRASTRRMCRCASDITEKDQRDLKFGLALGVDLVALSFVQSGADTSGARR